MTQATRTFFVAFLLALAAAAVFALPLLQGEAARSVPPISSVEEQRLTHVSRFVLEQHLSRRSREPLAWSCAAGQGNRIRYLRDTCFAEHILEIEFDHTRGGAAVSLLATGEAQFIGHGGEVLESSAHLDPSTASALREYAQSAVYRLSPTIPSSQMPAYLSALEACIDGAPHTAIRLSSRDEAFESVARNISELTGVTLSRKSPAGCM